MQNTVAIFMVAVTGAVMLCSVAQASERGRMKGVKLPAAVENGLNRDAAGNVQSFTAREAKGSGQQEEHFTGVFYRPNAVTEPMRVDRKDVPPQQP